MIWEAARLAIRVLEVDWDNTESDHRFSEECPPAEEYKRLFKEAGEHWEKLTEAKRRMPTP